MKERAGVNLRLLYLSTSSERAEGFFAHREAPAAVSRAALQIAGLSMLKTQ
jgi:hypothetical protein